MSAVRVIIQRRLSLVLRVASVIGIALTIGCAIGLASEDFVSRSVAASISTSASSSIAASTPDDDSIAIISLILALTILRSLAHLWTSRCLREPELDARRFALAVYFLAVVAQCFAVATQASWLVPILLAWPVTLALLLGRRDARWLVIADPPLPAFVILR